jgi:hypothetical protein
MKADAAKQAHRADGHHDGGQAQPRHQKPLTAPQSSPRSARSPQFRRARPGLHGQPHRGEASAMMEATDRSISPAMISMAMAKAIIAFSVKLKVASDRFQAFRK